jgi:hypothetical protein
MTAPLDSIIDVSSQKLPPVALVREWDLPEADRTALTSWGLPVVGQMRPQFQVESAPVIEPNVASDLERVLISPEQRLYKLVQWGSDSQQQQIGAVAGTGRVLVTIPKPLTAADVPIALRENFRDAYRPAVRFLNSSVRQFAEVAWRWRVAVHLLVELEDDEPHFTRPTEELEAHDRRIDACRDIVLGNIERIDSQVRADDPDSLWRAVVTFN